MPAVSTQGHPLRHCQWSQQSSKVVFRTHSRPRQVFSLRSRLKVCFLIQLSIVSGGIPHKQTLFLPVGAAFCALELSPMSRTSVHQSGLSSIQMNIRMTWLSNPVSAIWSNHSHTVLIKQLSCMETFKGTHKWKFSHYPLTSCRWKGKWSCIFNKRFQKHREEIDNPFKKMNHRSILFDSC